jgi:regulator of RNase E activity RraB
VAESEREGEWELYPTQLNEDGNPAVVLFEATVAGEAPLESHDHLTRVIVTLQDPDPETMLVQASESKVLYAMEDALVKKMTGDFGARYVGRVATLGVCDFAFYLPAPDGLEAALTKVMGAWPKYEYELDSHKDTEWEFYGTILFPSREEWQWIMDNRVVNSLEDQGDPLETSRKVDHHLDLPDKESVDKFMDGLAGFKLVGTEPNEEGGLTIQISGEHAADLDTVQGMTLFLLDRAEELGGDYDGWGCAVMESEG